MTNQATAKPVMIRQDVLLGNIGYSLNWTWLFILLGSHFFDSDQYLVANFGVYTGLCRLLFILGTLLVLFSQKFGLPLARYPKISMGFFSLSPCLLIVGKYLLAENALWVWIFVGCGYGLAMMQWPSFIMGIQHSKVKPFHGLCMAEAAMIIAVILSLKDWLSPILIICIPLISVIFYFAAVSKQNSTLEEEKLKKENPILLPVRFCVMANGVALTYLVMLFLEQTEAYSLEIILYAILLLIVAASFVLNFDYRKRHLFDEQNIIRIILLIGVFVIFPSGFLPPLVASVFICLALAVLLVTRIQSFSSLYANIVTFKVDALYCFTSERVYPYFGFFIGFLIYVVSKMFPVDVTAYTSMLVGGIVVIGATLVGFNSHSPVDESLTTGSDSFALGQINTETKQKVWENACELFCRENGLTEREGEIMFLFTKGLTAESIAGDLFISISTVRAHIYNIYQKTNVHSRQELCKKVTILKE